MEPRDTARSDEEPGMLELNLRILGDVDSEQKQYLAEEQELELQCAHPCVFPVIESIQAIIMFTDDYKKGSAVSKMETIQKKYPTNINVIKNLAEMYKRASRYKEAKEVEKILEDLKKDGGSGYELEIARSKLEKAYILLMDLHAETRKTPATLIEEARRVINEDMKRSTGPRKDLQRSAVKNANEALTGLHGMQKSLMGAKSNCTIETKHGREMAEDFFKGGIESMETLAENDRKIETELLIWKHYYGKACNRIGSTPKLVLRTSEKKTYYHRAIELFDDVIKNINIFNTAEESAERIGVVVCKERSYAYLGHLIITKNRIISGKDSAPPECIASFWENPWSLFCEAIAVSRSHKKAPDRVTLNRLALTLIVAEKEAHTRGPGRQRLELLIKTMQGENDPRRRSATQMRRLVQQTSTEQRPGSQYKLAEVLCEMSLKKWPHPNWFAHFVQMRLYLTWYRSQFDTFKKSKGKHANADLPRPDKTLLDKAIRSGENVLQSRKTTETLLDIATCFYYKAINPKVGKEFKKGVEEGCEKFIYRAIDYLQTAKDYHECENHARKFALLGQCLFDIGDTEKGIHFMKTASVMEQSYRDPVNFETASKFICEAYVHESRKDRKYDLLQDLWIIMDENMRRYGKRLNYHLIGVANSYPHPVIDMLNTIKDETEKFCERTKRIVDVCLSTLCSHNAKRVCERAERVKNSLPELSVLVFEHSVPLYLRSSDFKFPPVQQSAKSFHQMMYDCYICYSEADLGWIQKILLPLLEQTDGEGFKCFVKGRDEGRNWKFSASEVLGNCFRVLLVIDNHFEKDGQSQYEMQTLHKYILDHSADDPDLNDRLIPIRRTPDYYPEELRTYHYLDFSKPPYENQMVKLYHVLKDIAHPEEETEGNDSEM